MTAALQTPMTDFFLEAHAQQSAARAAAVSGHQKGLAVENFGIPWSFHHGHFQGTNRCAMDTILMTLFVHMKMAG
jgi:hypothetical protein